MAYLVNAPVSFVNTNSGQVLDFNAGATSNIVRDFVVTTAGDLVYRASGADNDLTRLAVGTNGQVLVVSGGLPSWGTNVMSRAGFSAKKTGAAALFTTTSTAVPNWDTTGGSGMFNSGGFVDATGVFTAPSTGVYAVDIYIQYGVTGGNTDNQSVKFVRADGAIFAESINVQASASWASDQVLHIHQALELTAADTFTAHIQSTGSNGVKTVSNVSRFNVTQVST